jgi:hypothetical protein
LLDHANGFSRQPIAQGIRRKSPVEQTNAGGVARHVPAFLFMDTGRLN